MWSITIQLMKKSARMLIPAGIAILIGTAFIASTFLFGNTLDDSLRTQLTAQFGQANYIATPQGANNPGYTVKDFHLDKLRAIQGVNGVRADASMSLQVNKGGKHSSMAAIGTSSDRKLLPIQIVQGGQPQGNGEIALPQSTAKQIGANIGDIVSVSIPSSQSWQGASTQPEQVRLVGLTSDPNGAFLNYGGAGVLSDNVLASIMGLQDFNAVNSAMVYFDINEANAGTALGRIRQELPKGFSVSSRQKAGDDAVKNLGGGQTSIITTFLLVFGVLAMFVAALVIANTFQVLVAQRRRTLALLRTIGAKKGQLYRSVILEAGLLGLIASALGIGFGIGLMAVICNSGVLAALGSKANLIVSWQVFLIPLAFGIVMTVLASLGSARSATNVTPLEALRPIELGDTRKTNIFRIVLGIVMVIVGGALTAFGLWKVWDSFNGSHTAINDQYITILLSAVAGCALVFLGLAITATFWLPLLMKAAGALVSTAGPSAKLAHANIQKNPRRVGATGVALLIGVTLVSCIATGAASGKQTINNTLDSHYSVDVIAEGPQLSQGSADKVAKISGVSATLYAPTAAGSTTDKNGKPISTLFVGVNNATDLQKVMHANLSGIAIDNHTALLSKVDANSGKDLQFKSGNGQFVFDAPNQGIKLALTIQQVDYRKVSSTYQAVSFVSAGNFNNGGLKASGHILLAKLNTADTSLAQTFNAIQTTLGSDGGVSVTGPIATRMQYESIINTMMTLLVGLLGIAILIALIGVANTLSLSVIERTRESATLRAIGMTRGQLRRSLAVEALLIALVSGVVGIVLGTLFGWAGSYLVFSAYGSVVLPVDWATDGIVLAIAALAALLASVFPARRAVRTPPVEALAEA